MTSDPETITKAKVLTPELYAALTAAYRLDPGKHAKTAKACNTTPRIAEKAFTRGWGTEWSPPIKAVFAQEATEARAKLLDDGQNKQAQTQAVRDAAHKQAVEARTREGRIIVVGESGVEALLAFTTSALAELFRKGVQQKLTAALTNANASPGEIIEVINHLSNALQRASAAAYRLQAMQAKHLGSIEESIDWDVPEVSLKEAARQLEEVLPMFNRLRELGVLPKSPDEELEEEDL
jgi:hypothetical protein